MFSMIDNYRKHSNSRPGCILRLNSSVIAEASQAFHSLARICFGYMDRLPNLAQSGSEKISDSSKKTSNQRISASVFAFEASEQSIDGSELVPRCAEVPHSAESSAPPRLRRFSTL
jgi:hypothetical protein